MRLLLWMVAIVTFYIQITPMRRIYPNPPNRWLPGVNGPASLSVLYVYWCVVTSVVMTLYTESPSTPITDLVMWLLFGISTSALKAFMHIYLHARVRTPALAILSLMLLAGSSVATTCVLLVHEHGTAGILMSLHMGTVTLVLIDMVLGIAPPVHARQGRRNRYENFTAVESDETTPPPSPSSQTPRIRRRTPIRISSAIPTERYVDAYEEAESKYAEVSLHNSDSQPSVTPPPPPVRESTGEVGIEISVSVSRSSDSDNRS
jgi:hypothetical protein